MSGSLKKKGGNEAGDADSDALIRASLETSRHRDLGELGLQLGIWLERRWGSGSTILSITAPDTSGASSEVFFLRIENAPFGPVAEATDAVLRLSPAFAVYPTVDLDLQFRCMQAASTCSEAPVPKMFAFEADRSALGSEFILMERGRGRGAPDWPSYVREGWIHDLPAAEQEQLWLNGVEAIAAVHATDLARGALVNADLPAPGSTMLDRMLAYWRLYLSLDSRGGSYPMLETAVDYLHRARPAHDYPPALVWGDASLRNMLFEGLRPSVLMDFEFAHIGIYAFDIAFYAMMDYVMAEGFAERTPRLPGFSSVKETLDYYEHLTGRPVANREYFLRMAVTYMALATTRVYQRLASEGRFSVEAVGNNPSLRTLSEVFTTGNLPP